MSRIVVLESESRPTESLRDGLAEDGWQVESFSSYEKAAAAITERPPQLVIASADVAGAEALLRDNSIARGGVGSLALVEPGEGNSAAAGAADSVVHRPFADQDLRIAVRSLVNQARAPHATAPDEGERLTSQDLFGDLLAEVEGETARPEPAPPASRAAAPPVAPVSQLDRELSGLLKSEPKRTPSASAKHDEPGVDDLLSKTLSGLELGEHGKKAPAKTAPPASAGQRPKKTAPAPPAKKATAPPPVDRLLDAVKPPPEAPRRAAAKPLDLSELDVLAKRPASEKTPTSPEAFATQKIAIPPATRGAGGPLEFGQYTLLDRIALGGMAEVWKARMKGVEGFQKTVAIKKILPHLTDSTDFVTMFVDEAKLAAQLNHTNIIHIYDLGKIDDDYYIAMEFVDGKDLRTILNTAREKNEPLPLSLSLLVASRLAAALDHAHRQKDFEGRPLGLVHRDVSPQNVLISFDGDIKLCDFGIVKAVSKASKTQMGALKGKLQYMSPEQAWGRPVDARSDIFSLGTLLFEMLTGRRLFAGESEMSVLDAVREGRIQAPRDLDPRVPLEVNATVLRALAREPKNRFQTAGDLQREIDGILASLKPAPSQHDLAAYVRRLFEVEARPERSAEAAPPVSKTAPKAKAAASVMPTPAAPAATEPAATLAPSTGTTDAALEAAPGGKKNLLWIGLAAAVVAAVLAFTLFRGGGNESKTPTSPSPTAGRPAVTTPAATGEGPRGEEASASSGETGEGETKPEPSVPAAPAATPATEPKQEAAKPETPKTEPAKTEPAKAESPKAEPASKPVASEPPKKDSAPAGPVSPPAVAIASPTPAPTSTESAAPASAPTNNTAPAPAPQPAAPIRPAPAAAVAVTPKAPTVREGDLVQEGPGVEPPVLVSVSKPEYPPIARRMRAEGTVVLSLLVDETGRVLDVRIESGVSSNVGLNEAAVAAAHTAKFRPAMKDGVRVKTWHRLTIPFKL